MQGFRALFASFVAIAALPLAGLIFLGIIMGSVSVTDFYKKTKDSIIKEYGLFDSPAIYIKDDERRARKMAEERAEYEEILAREKAKQQTNADATAEADRVSTDELLAAPEIAREIENWKLESAKNPPMSPIAQATAFLSSAKNTVNDGVKYNELTDKDITLITQALLSNDLKKLAELDKIYGRKNMVIENESGVTKRLSENAKGDLTVLTLTKQRTAELEAEIAK